HTHPTLKLSHSFGTSLPLNSLIQKSPLQHSSANSIRNSPLLKQPFSINGAIQLLVTRKKASGPSIRPRQPQTQSEDESQQFGY
ncbi:hypothetical protein LINGRAHAP2_LOCUS2535, partial [Linum grandiflorum]